MSIDDSGVYAGRPRDARVAQRRTQLVDAGLDLMGTEGAAAVTMRAVTRNAGLSPRYFYESFADRTELLVAIFDRALGAVRESVDMAMAAADPDPIPQTRAAIDATLHAVDTDPRLARILVREPPAEPSLRQHAASALTGLILHAARHVGDDDWYRSADPTLLAIDISALTGALSTLFVDWSDGRLEGVTHQQLVDYATALVHDMVTRRVTAPPSPTLQRRPADRG